MTLKAPVQRRPCQIRDRGLKGIQAVIQGQLRMALERATAAASSSVTAIERSSLGPVLRSSTVARLRHFVNVFGLMPILRLICAGEACDRCIAALMACAVVALL
jgi:hypothetical protein